MRIGIIGAGRIGGNTARRLAKAGHELKLSFARDDEKLAEELGEPASVGTPRESVTFADVVVVSVPWDALPEALAQAGPLEGTIVIDTTNQFGSGPKPTEGETAAAFNSARMPGARYTKSFNTLTAAFQAQTADRGGDERIVQWLCGDDADAKRIVAGLSRTPATSRSTSAIPPAAPSWKRLAGRAPSTGRNTGQRTPKPSALLEACTLLSCPRR